VQNKRKTKFKIVGFVLFGVLIVVIVLILITMIMPFENKQDKDINQPTTQTLTERVPEFETPGKYSLIIPNKYIISELPPAGTDFLLGISYVNCIHKENVPAAEETCDISIYSVPEKIIEGSLEEDIKSGGDAVIDYRMTKFAGDIGYEVLFKLPEYGGYKIVFLHNGRMYSITARLMKNVTSLDEAKKMLSEEQKMIIDSFKFDSSFGVDNSISLKKAESVAQEFITKQLGNESKKLVLQPEKTQERKFGYVFFYSTKEYLETKDVSKLIPGVGPVAVEYSGKVFLITSSVNPAKAIEEYEQQWVKSN